MDSLRGKNGQSLLEALIGLSLLMVGIGIVLGVVFGAQRTFIDRANSREARRFTEEGLTAAKRIVKSDWSGVEDGTYGLSFSTSTKTWQFSGGLDQNGIFTRAITITSISSFEKGIKTLVSWQTDPMRPEKVQFVTRITNWENVITGTGGDPGDPGGGGPTGDWQNPQTLGAVDLGSGVSATGLDVINKTVYMTAEASVASRPDFFIVDATDGANPFIVTSINTGPSLNGLDVSGAYAYVASRNTTAQLQIIDVSNPTSPFVISFFQLPDVSGSGAVGKSVFYLQSKVYMGTKNATGPEFHVIDVSNPIGPVHLGSLEINADVNAIYVNGTRAYLATSGDPEIKVLDVTSPGSISQIGAFDLSDDEDALSLSLVGSTLYVGRKEEDDEFMVFDVTNPASIQTLGSVNPDDDVNDIAVSAPLTFLATSESNAELQIFNIANPANITLWSVLNFPQVATGIDYENNFVYVSVRSNDGLRIITSQ